MNARAVAVLVSLFAAVALAEKPFVRGGEDPPQDLRLTGCSLSAEAVRGGKLFEITPEGRGPQVVWIGLVGNAEPHLVFAWFPAGQPKKSRCVDAGLIDPWMVELSLLPQVPVLRAIQTLRGNCLSLRRTVVLAWTSGTRDFELVSSRTTASPRLLCGDPSLAQEPEDERLSRAAELLAGGEVHDAERLILGLIGERPWDPDARAALSETRRRLSSAGRR
jgi:hypothetical protein